MKHKLTIEQTKKFVEGYNAHAKLWNAGKSDGGKSPYRANSWSDIGYQAARSEVLARQVAKETGIVVKLIDTASAQSTFNASYN